MLNDDFVDWVDRSFDMVPDRYKVDLSVTFDDLEGYTEVELYDICTINLEHEVKIQAREVSRYNRLALALCGVGLLLLIAFILVTALWEGDSTIKTIVTFQLEILATVPFWGAVDVYFIQNGAVRRRARSLAKRFHAISFHRKDESDGNATVS